MKAKTKKNTRKQPVTYRRQIDRDLAKLAEKWRRKGMPVLTWILLLVREFYARELEGYLLGALWPIHRLVRRTIDGGNYVVDSNIDRPTRTRASRR